MILKLTTYIRKLNKQKLIGIVVVGILAVLGVTFLISGHALSPFVSVEAELGSLSGAASPQPDSNASGGKYVQFGGASGGALTPMPIISRYSGVTAYASGGNANYGKDSDYSTAWNPSGTSGWLAYDLSSVPVANRTKVILAWYTNPETGYSTSKSVINNLTPANPGNLVINYTVELNAAPGGGSSAPTTGWVTNTTVTNNPFLSRQHVIDMTGYNWIRLNISSANSIDLNMDIADISKGITDDWMFYGDSITAYSDGHENSGNLGPAGLQPEGPPLATLINTDTKGVYTPITENGGMASTFSADMLAAFPTLIKYFPGHFVTLNFGTNDSWNGSGNPQTYYNTMASLVQDVINNKMVPVVAKIPWPDNPNYPNWEAQVQAFNAEIDKLYIAYPQIVKGPDFYNIMLGHTNYYQSPGNVHPGGTGVMVMRQAWAASLLSQVYQ